MNPVLQAILVIVQLVTALIQFGAGTLTALCSFCALPIAAVATVFAWMAANATRQNTRAQITKSLLDDYAAPEMTEAINFIRDAWRGQPAQIAESEFNSPEINKYAPQRIASIDTARRQISHYFQKVYLLYRTGMIDLTIVRTVAGKQQAQFYLEWLEGLERVAGGQRQYDDSSFKFYAGLYQLKRYQAVPPNEPAPDEP